MVAGDEGGAFERWGRSMKVVHFAHCFVPVYGGTTTRLQNLLSGSPNEYYLYVPQAPSGHVPEGVGILKDREVFDNIHVRRCRLDQSFRPRIPVVKLYGYLKSSSDRLVRSVKERGIQIVHGHNPLEFAMAAVKYAKRKGLPFVYEVHTLSGNAPSPRRGGRIFNGIQRLVGASLLWKEKRIIQSADAVITQTEGMKRRIMHFSDSDADKIKLVPNGVDERKFDPLKWRWKGRDLRRERNWVDKIIFMYSGYFDDINGIDMFLDGVQELPAEIRGKIKVVLLGYGPLQEYVKDKCAKQHELIEYLGMMDHNVMPVYYCACDVFVVPRPSTPAAESFVPMKLLEAMAAEKLILGSDVGGITEVVADNVNGIVFKKGKVDELLRKMNYIVENMENLERLGKQARKDVVRKYSWEESRRRLQIVYESIV